VIDPLECSPYLQLEPRTRGQAHFDRVLAQLARAPSPDRGAELEPGPQEAR
jgi:hypothetical protein